MTFLSGRTIRATVMLTLILVVLVTTKFYLTGSFLYILPDISQGIDLGHPRDNNVTYAGNESYLTWFRHKTRPGF